MKRFIPVAIFLLGAPASAFSFVPSSLPRQSSSSSSLSMARRGKGLSTEGGSKNKLGGKPKSISSEPLEGAAAAPKANWVETSIPSIKSLPRETNAVVLVNTDVPSLMNKGTNPTGAVSIVNYGDITYCFSSACASCKIPMAKGKVLDANDETGDDARIECNFCGGVYNLRTGMPTKKEGGKMMGFLFSKNEAVPLPVYALGERKGKVFINVA